MPAELYVKFWLVQNNKKKLKMSISYNQVCDSSDCSCSAYPKKYLVL